MREMVCGYCGKPALGTYDYDNGERYRSILYCSALHRSFLVYRHTPKALRRKRRIRKEVCRALGT